MEARLVSSFSFSRAVFVLTRPRTTEPYCKLLCAADSASSVLKDTARRWTSVSACLYLFDANKLSIEEALRILVNVKRANAKNSKSSGVIGCGAALETKDKCARGGLYAPRYKSFQVVCVDL